MLISKFGKAKIEDITALEKMYNIKLGEKYKEFLLKYNGGYTPKTNCKKSKSDLRVFYGINSSKYNVYDLDIQSWIEKGCFPIASDSFGDYYCIDIKNENSDLVYFCDHEKLFSKIVIADTFYGFVKSCKSDMISEEAKMSVGEREKLMIEEGNGHLITEALREAWRKECEKYSGMVQEEVIV